MAGVRLKSRRARRSSHCTESTESSLFGGAMAAKGWVSGNSSCFDALDASGLANYSNAPVLAAGADGYTSRDDSTMRRSFSNARNSAGFMVRIAEKLR